MKKNISYNRTAIVNQGGQVSSITISRAIEIGTKPVIIIIIERLH